MYKKELNSKFDAGVAIDSIFFENCHLPQPPKEGSCAENQWQCNSMVISFDNLKVFRSLHNTFHD